MLITRAQDGVSFYRQCDELSQVTLSLIKGSCLGTKSSSSSCPCAAALLCRFGLTRESCSETPTTHVRPTPEVSAPGLMLLTVRGHKQLKSASMTTRCGTQVTCTGTYKRWCCRSDSSCGSRPSWPNPRERTGPQKNSEKTQRGGLVWRQRVMNNAEDVFDFWSVPEPHRRQFYALSRWLGPIRSRQLREKPQAPNTLWSLCFHTETRLHLCACTDASHHREAPDSLSLHMCAWLSLLLCIFAVILYIPACHCVSSCLLGYSLWFDVSLCVCITGLCLYKCVSFVSLCFPWGTFCSVAVCESLLCVSILNWQQNVQQSQSYTCFFHLLLTVELIYRGFFLNCIPSPCFCPLHDLVGFSSGFTLSHIYSQFVGFLCCFILFDTWWRLELLVGPCFGQTLVKTDLSE